MVERDPLEFAFLTGAVRALRNRAGALRQRAAPGVTKLDRTPPVLVIASESAHALKIAGDFEAIANAIEAEAAP